MSYQPVPFNPDDIETFAPHDVYLYHCASVQVKPNSFMLSLFAQPICSNARLIVELDLSHNYFGELGLYPLAETMCECTTMAKLSLRNTGMTNDAGVFLASIAQKHPALRVVDFSSNEQLTTPTGDAVLRSVRWNPRLEQFHIGDTYIPADIQKKGAERLFTKSSKNCCNNEFR
eukprot:PhF_6_TR13869/c0_g1_i1/m.22259